MGEQATRRVPTGIKVIAWSWIVSAALLGLSAVLGGMADSMLGGLPASGEGVPPALSAMAASGGDSLITEALQLAIAVAALWSGIALLRLKSWARRATELLSWLGLVWTIGFGVFFVSIWNSIAGEIAQESGLPLEQGMLQNAGVVTGVVLTIALAVPMILMIRYLRGAKARAACLPGGKTGA